jgi:hypothetical protein
MQVAGKRGLGDAELLLSQAAAQIFLIADTTGGDESEDLAMAKCFGGAHLYNLFIQLYKYTGQFCSESNKFLHFVPGANGPGIPISFEPGKFG